MYYKTFKDKRLSALGFGTMRLPTLDDGSIDEVRLQQLVDLAMAAGINYFDTARTYQGGKGERALGKALSKYPRSCYYLASKYPGHEIHDSYDPAAVFELQLKECGVDYFDFYLLHNVIEGSIETYLDPRWGIIDYFLEQKKLGRIKHLGFSCHARKEGLRRFLDAVGDKMEFCQIQLNWLDWTLQQAQDKYFILSSRGIPVWVMEPVRGGTLAKLSESQEKRMKAIYPDRSVASWSFRFLHALPYITMTLSGMSNMEQMLDNIRTYSQCDPLEVAELSMLLDFAEEMNNSLPCTRCRYCCDSCPMGLDIPMLLSVYNDVRFEPSITGAMPVTVLPEEKQPSACIGCGACAKLCPQGIDVPRHMRDFAGAIEKLPRWADICRQREEEARKKKEE